jgi:hypothetical protein
VQLRNGIIALLIAWGSSSAQSAICITPLHGYHYLTCNDYTFYLDAIPYTIPAGFDTDLASIPRIVWPIMSPAKSELMEAAIIHDWLYKETCYFTREETDVIFYDMLRANGTPRWQASIMYYAVRTFGGAYYQDEDCE